MRPPAALQCADYILHISPTYSTRFLQPDAGPLWHLPNLPFSERTHPMSIYRAINVSADAIDADRFQLAQRAEL